MIEAERFIRDNPPTPKTRIFHRSEVLAPDHPLFRRLRWRNEVVGLTGECAVADYLEVEWEAYERIGLPDFILPCTCTLDAKGSIWPNADMHVSHDSNGLAYAYALVSPTVFCKKAESSRQEFYEALQTMTLKAWAYHHSVIEDGVLLPGGIQYELERDQCNPIPTDHQFYEAQDWCVHQEGFELGRAT